MAIDRHPDLATLMTCSAGSQPEALCAVVVSHIALCPRCQREFAKMETIGVALFETLAPVPEVAATPRRPSREAAPHAENGSGCGHAHADEGVPAPLRPVLGDLDSLDWRPLGSGVEEHRLVLSDHARGDLRLLRLQPGARLPAHGHQGEELTLVLRGACVDERGRYSIGDFSDLDDETVHSVSADGDGPCILLVASETAPAFACVDG